MNIIKEHEERKSVDDDGSEDWCIVPYSDSFGTFDPESPQMSGKHEENITLNDDEFVFCVISSSDDKGDESFTIQSENVLLQSNEEELLTAEIKEDPRQMELNEDILQFSDIHFQIDENHNHLIKTTLLHQANFHHKVISKGSKITFPDVSTEENNDEKVISPNFLDQVLQKSQSDLHAGKISENLVPPHQDDFCKVNKVEDEILYDTNKVISENLFIEAFHELQEELNFEILSENEITERENYQLLDFPHGDFCDVSLEDVMPFDDVCKEIVPNSFLSDVVSELQKEPINKEEVEHERLVSEKFQNLECSQDNFYEVTAADVFNEFKSNPNLTNNFKEVAISPSLSNKESYVEDIKEKVVRLSVNSEDWNTCISSQHNYSTTFPYDDGEVHNATQEEIDLDNILMKYEHWDSHPAKVNKHRKVAAFNRQRVRLNKKRSCWKGHWNCKLIAYHYS